VRIDVDFSGIAAELRERATTGAIDERRRDMEYVYACSRRVPETGATLCFTRCMRTDTRSRGWPADPACRGQLHLSVRCASRAERDAWVHAILGADVSKAWAQAKPTRTGYALGISHWYVFCDPAWRSMRVADSIELRRADLRPAIELGLAPITS
jgi:hypothetical protein